MKRTELKRGISIVLGICMLAVAAMAGSVVALQKERTEADSDSTQSAAQTQTAETGTQDVDANDVSNITILDDTGNQIVVNGVTYNFGEQDITILGN